MGSPPQGQAFGTTERALDLADQPAVAAVIQIVQRLPRRGGARSHALQAALRGRVNGAFRTLILISNTASPALLSTIATAYSTSAAFAAAGVLGLASVAVSALGPLRKYDIRDAQDEAAAIESAAESEPTPAD